MDLPIENCHFPVRKRWVYQRVYPISYFMIFHEPQLWIYGNYGIGFTTLSHWFQSETHGFLGEKCWPVKPWSLRGITGPLMDPLAKHHRCRAPCSTIFKSGCGQKKKCFNIGQKINGLLSEKSTSETMVFFNVSMVFFNCSMVFFNCSMVFFNFSMLLTRK